jgi:serine/threonine protein kinase
MSQINHNSIIKILETLESEKYIFIIMEYISGGNL